MTKSELIHLLADENPTLFHSHIERIVVVIFEKITTALANGDRVELRGFGVFSVKAQGARTGRNPRTGAEVEIPAKFMPHFKTGKLLRERLNGRT